MSKVLVFRIGQLGDTIVSLPALWAVRAHFKDSRLVFLSDRHVGKSYVLANDLLRGSGIVDEFLDYPFDDSKVGRILTPLRMAVLAARLRARRFDALVYLVPSNRMARQVERDRTFFRLAGIPRLLGMEGFPRIPTAADGYPLPLVPSEADLLLERMKLSGVPVPAPGRGRMDLGLNQADQRVVDDWRATLPPDGGRPWIAVGPGTKMEAKRWPLERYADVVAKLIAMFDVWPLVVGGPEDAEDGRRLLAQWGRGYNSAGVLGLRPSAAAIARSVLYLGNDTGSMHMAAAVGVRCVAIFSARDARGWWYPYGEGHRVFRTDVDCEGCRLFTCVERRMECIFRIGATEVLEACIEILGGSDRVRARIEDDGRRSQQT